MTKGPTAETLCTASARQMASWIRGKAISSRELIEAHLARIDRVNPALNAVVTLDRALAIESACAADQAMAKGETLGPLHGVPITLKDSFDSAGLITTAGTLGRKTYQPERDATALARLRAAGAVLLGKTNTPELTVGVGTENQIFGRTLNPHDLGRSPSGSSGGAAAIIAAGGSPLDLGSDTGGSIREPAHACGIAGLKPTAGRVPLTGHVVSFDFGPFPITQVGPMARTVEDLALALQVIAGPDGIDPLVVPVPLAPFDDLDITGLRIAVFTGNGVIEAEAPVAAAVERAAQALVDAGARATAAMPPVISQVDDLYERLRNADGASCVHRLLTRFGTTQPGPALGERISPARAIDGAALSGLIEEVMRFNSAMLAFMTAFDAIVCPPAIRPAETYAQAAQQGYRNWSFLTPFNLTGWPCAVVPAGAASDGLPVGVQIVAGPWREDVVLRAAKAVEDELGGYQVPDIEAST